jgi:hypothetical protein
MLMFAHELNAINLVHLLVNAHTYMFIIKFVGLMCFSDPG